MLIGLISDTHDKLGRTQRAIHQLQAEGVEALFHCGDITGAAIVAVCGVVPSYFVFGNNDDDRDPELRMMFKTVGAVPLGWGGIVTLAGKQLAMTHGHLSREQRRLLAEEPDFLFLGHSHYAEEYQHGPTRVINPGALHRASQYTVGVLDLASGQLRRLEVD